MKFVLKMKKLILFVMLLCAFSQVSVAELVQEGDPDTSISDNYTFYKLEENGIHYYFAYGPFEDGTGNSRSTYQFYAVYHDEDVPAPYRIKIPSEFVWDGVTRKVEGYRSGEYTFGKFKLSEKQLTFNKICFPKEVYPPRDKQGELTRSFTEFPGFVSHVNASEFIVDKDNPGFASVDGVLMTKGEDVIVRYPVCRKRVNYYVPESVTKLQTSCFSGITVPVILNDVCREYSYQPAFVNYPFYGLYGRNGVLDYSIYQKNSEIKALDHADIEVYPLNAVAISFLSTEVGGITGKNLVFEKYLFSNIYNTPEIDGFARRVEFTYPDDVTIRIVNNFDDSDVVGGVRCLVSDKSEWVVGEGEPFSFSYSLTAKENISGKLKFEIIAVIPGSNTEEWRYVYDIAPLSVGETITGIAQSDFIPNPGFYTCTAKLNGKTIRVFNVACDIENYKVADDRPDDFDEFWALALADLERVPIDPQLTLNEKYTTTTYNYYDVTLHSAGDFTGDDVIIRGYYVEPKTKKNFPLRVNFYGYDSDRNSQLSPPGIPSEGGAILAVYTRGQGLNNRDGLGNPYGDFFVSNLEDPDQYYYRGAYLDAVRILEFAFTLDNVDKDRIFTYGGSQGAALALAAAALSPRKPRFAVLSFPFMGNFPLYLESARWPANIVNGTKLNRSEVLHTLAYFDTKNIATLMTVPLCLGITLQDTTCPPWTQAPILSSLPETTEVEWYIAPDSEHSGTPLINERNREYTARMLKSGLARVLKDCRRDCIYNTPEIDGFARRVEFTYPDDVTIRIVNNLDDSDAAVFDKETDLEKIITYVSAFQKPRFEEMYEKSNFPQNAIIEETPNELYLYPELCHGPWVNKQTQFVYGLCRFGDSQLADREWDTDNYEIATIDDTGLLTAYKTGSVTVTLKCTVQRGNIYEASEVINITEEDFIETGIAEDDEPLRVDYPRGVYNMQGILVGESLEGLPKGLYISGGRKIVVK